MVDGSDSRGRVPPPQARQSLTTTRDGDCTSQSPEASGTRIASPTIVSGHVMVEDAERANLLELMLASLLHRRLASPSARAHANAIAGPVEIKAGAMHATLLFSAGDVSITRNHADYAHARVRGSLAAVLDAALGRRRFSHVLHRDLRVTGSPRVLWHLLALLRAGDAR